MTVGIFVIMDIWVRILRLLHRIPFNQIMSFKQALGLERTDAEDNNQDEEQNTTRDVPTFFKKCEEKRDELRYKQTGYIEEPPSAPMENESISVTKPLL